MSKPLMPKATAMWLLNFTTLTFDQIAEFCALHPLEIKAMADDMHPEKIVPLDPVMMGQLTREEIAAAEADSRKRLVMTKPSVEVAPAKAKGRPRYTPVSRRQDRPDAIAWLVRNHPELTDVEIGKLVGTTKATIQQIRTRSHWNIANIKPVDPVTLGLTSQLELDLAVEKASGRKSKGAPAADAKGATLRPASEAVKPDVPDEDAPQLKYDPASVFASFQRARDKT
ncbi:MAG: cell cycle transcriptional regulator TrcR [Alphaproteobacteria bacterium]|jgi:hypothetical protein|nr:cell cycle transcriptional regulator TrcR [Alphaproteobacteria bacterium]